LALQCSQHRTQTKQNHHSQIPREIHITPILHRQMVAQQLQRDDVQQPLQAVDRLGTRIVFAPAGMPSSPSLHSTIGCALRAVICAKANCTLFGVERVLRHDDDDGHVLVDERERAVLQLAGEDTYEGMSESVKEGMEGKEAPPSECM
jgi:hypothetical protein